MKGVNPSLLCSSPTQRICQPAQHIIFGPGAAEMSSPLCQEAAAPGEGARLTDEDVNTCVFIIAPPAAQTESSHCLFTAKTLN